MIANVYSIRRRFWICLLAVIAVLFITGTVFADDEVPAGSADTTAVIMESSAAEGSGGEATDSQEVSESDTGSASDEVLEESSPSETEDQADTGQNASAEDITVDDETASEAYEQPSDENVGEAESEQSDEDLTSDEPANSDLPEDVEESTESEETQDVSEVETAEEDEGILDEAAEEGVELTSGGDPYWKIGTQYYSVVASADDCYGNSSVGGETCWVVTSGNLISYALDRIEENRLPTDKKLYVLTGTYTGDLNISGTYLSQLNGLIGVGRIGDHDHHRECYHQRELWWFHIERLYHYRRS